MTVSTKVKIKLTDSDARKFLKASAPIEMKPPKLSQIGKKNIVAN